MHEPAPVRYFLEVFAMNAVEIVESQKKDWNKVAPAWEKWDADIDKNWSFVNHLLVGYARIRPGLKVLDLGSGTGHPAFLAAAAVGRKGQLLGVDLAENMVQAANKKAKSLGLAQLAFEAADVTHLKFESNGFDAVLSRFCFMFVPEIEKALAEVLRVLKPGAYFSAAVWSAADKNPYLKLPIDVLKTFVEIPAPVKATMDLECRMRSTHFKISSSCVFGIIINFPRRTFS